MSDILLARIGNYVYKNIPIGKKIVENKGMDFNNDGKIGKQENADFDNNGIVSDEELGLFYSINRDKLPPILDKELADSSRNINIKMAQKANGPDLSKNPKVIDSKNVVIWPPLYSCKKKDGSLILMNEAKRQNSNSNWGISKYTKVTNKGVHFGIDCYPQYNGEKVHVIAGGVVVATGYHSTGAGNYVVVESVKLDKKGNYHICYDMYLHLGKIQDDIKAGKVLDAGDTIGITGRTGSVAGQGISWDILCIKSFEITDISKVKQLLTNRREAVSSGDWKKYVKCSSSIFWTGYKQFVGYYRYQVAQKKGEAKSDNVQPVKPTIIKASNPVDFNGMTYMPATEKHQPPRIAKLNNVI